MAKNNRFGQAEILSDSDYARIFKQISNPSHRLLLSIARFTGERWGAIVQLRVRDCYDESTHRTPQTEITFRASTRPASPYLTRTTRQVPVHPLLRDELERFHRPGSDWLWPRARFPSKHVTFQAADRWFRLAVARAGLEARGIATHSTRRTLITNLSSSGVSLPVLRKITGHLRDRVLLRYIEVDPAQVSL